MNEKGEVLAVAPRSVIHTNPSLIHRVVHVLIFDSAGKVLLQKRSMNKDVAPGRWDTSVGGHVAIGEELSLGAGREMKEELGITDCEMEYLHTYIHTGDDETELVTTYRCIYSGRIDFNPNEIDEVRYWSLDEMQEVMGKGILSGHFEDEFLRYLRIHTPRISGP